MNQPTPQKPTWVVIMVPNCEFSILSLLHSFLEKLKHEFIANHRLEYMILYCKLQKWDKLLVICKEADKF